LKTKIRDSKSVANIKTNNSLTLNNNKERRQSSSKKFPTTKSEKNINPIERKNFHKKPLKEEITLPSEGKENKSKDDGLGKTMPNRNNKFNTFQKKKDQKETKEKKDSDKNVASKTPKNGEKKEFNLTMKDKRNNKKTVKSHDDAGKVDSEVKESKDTEIGSDKEKIKKVATKTPLYKKPADKVDKNDKVEKSEKKEKEVSNNGKDHKVPISQSKVSKPKNEDLKTPVKNNAKAANNLDKTKEKQTKPIKNDKVKTEKVKVEKSNNETTEVQNTEAKVETVAEQKIEEPEKQEEKVQEQIKKEEVATTVEQPIEKIENNAETNIAQEVKEADNN
jgi:hypothetical protein